MKRFNWNGTKRRRKFSPYPNNYCQPPPTSASPALLFSFSPISGLSLLFFSLFLFFVDKLLFNLHSKTQNMWENHCIYMSWFALNCSNKITNFPPAKKTDELALRVKKISGGGFKKNFVSIGFIRISFYYK